MSRAETVIAIFLVFSVSIFLIGCGSNSLQSSTTTSSSGFSGTGSGSSGTSSGSGSGGSGSGSSSSTTAPGFAAGIGASGQTASARFLYADPLPGNGPDTAVINSNGKLTLGNAGSANVLNPMTMAIDPSGSFLFQTARGAPGVVDVPPGGLFVYAINRTNGTLGTAIGSYLTNKALVDDVVDNQGKFVFAMGDSGGVYAFSNQSGALIAVSGSPFSTPAPSAPFPAQPGNVMAVDQTNKYLYVSTSGGIVGFNINQTTGQLTPVPGSPFATDVTGPWTIVVTPNNSFLYMVQGQTQASSAGNAYGFSVDQASGALTPLPGSPFSGKCGTVVPTGTVAIPGPDNMTIASTGKFMYDNCGIYSINETSGSLTQLSNQGPGDWPVIDPTGNLLWAISTDQTACFSCDVGVQAYSVDLNTGAFTAIANGYVSITDTEVGDLNSLAIVK
jgi:Lactonase, 7-bladed beta-propeller